MTGGDPHGRRPLQRRALGVHWRPVHRLIACAAGPCGVTAVVAQASLVTHQYLAAVTARIFAQISDKVAQRAVQSHLGPRSATEGPKPLDNQRFRRATIMTDHPPPVVQRGSAVLIRGAALPLHRATLVLIALGWSTCGDSLRCRARCALDRPYIVRSVSSVSTPRGTFMKTSACMLVASVFRVMMSDRVVFCTMRTSAGSSAFSK